MKQVLVIGSGISGMSAAIHCAKQGMKVLLVSPFPSERSQSVMAAGGINAALDHLGEGDTIQSHVEDTLKGGCYLAGENAVRGLCENAPAIVRWLESIGTVFSTDDSGRIAQRAFGGQSFRRTCYAGASTGKQIVSALVMETRRFEAKGLIERRLFQDFHSALIYDGVCYGALLYDESRADLLSVPADALIMATGGMNALFGKTTGSTQCDGYAAGRLFLQGAALKNLEFIQYHPTTMETAQKRMLISEAVRGEGGRLYYLENGKRVYFMEDLFGAKGNLMPRDVVSRHMYLTGKEIFLDVSFLGEERISERLPEVKDLCLKYRNIDIAKESIPVAPSVHFFMGGLAVDNHHQTNIQNLYAVGECASMYHGANRLGGNSLLAAVHSGMVCAESISREDACPRCIDGEGALAFEKTGASLDFSSYIAEEKEKLERIKDSRSPFPVMYIRDMTAESMWGYLGIVRDEETLSRGIEEISYYISLADKLHYDSSVLPYFTYSLPGILSSAKATLVSARARKESRGAHYRSDHPETKDAYRASSIIRYDQGQYTVSLDEERRFES